MKKITFKVGDSVVVKERVMCPDCEGLSIAGWQGRVTDVELEAEDGDSPPGVCIQWDSHTLKNMPEDHIRESEEEGPDWETMWLNATDVEPTEPRDTLADVTAAVREIASRHRFDHLEEQGARIAEVLADCDPDDDWECMNAWGEHLESVLSLPVEAEIFEHQEEGPLRAGDRVKVIGIVDVDDLYGLIVDVRRGRRKYACPLCDLEATDKDSPNCQPLRDYSLWFANR